MDNLVKEAKTEIYNLAFNDEGESTMDRKWSDIQFWEIMKGLSKKKFVLYQLFYDDILLHDNVVN